MSLRCCSLPESLNPQSGARTDNLHGIYWEGKLNASPAPGERTRLVLRQQNYPVNGDQRLLEKYTLFAPDEPSSLCLKLIASSLLGSPCRIGTRVGEHWG